MPIDARALVSKVPDITLNAEDYVTEPGTPSRSGPRMALYFSTDFMEFECDTVDDKIKRGVLLGDFVLPENASTPASKNASGRSNVHILDSNEIAGPSANRYPVHFVPTLGDNRFIVDVTVNGTSVTISGLSAAELETSYRQCQSHLKCKVSKCRELNKCSVKSMTRVRPSQTQVFIHPEAKSTAHFLECDIKTGALSGTRNYTIHGRNAAELAFAMLLKSKNITGKSFSLRSVLSYATLITLTLPIALILVLGFVALAVSAPNSGTILLVPLGVGAIGSNNSSSFEPSYNHEQEEAAKAGISRNLNLYDKASAPGNQWGTNSASQELERLKKIANEEEEIDPVAVSSRNRASRVTSMLTSAAAGGARRTRMKTRARRHKNRRTRRQKKSRTQ